MNKSFKTIYNIHTQSWVAVSEITVTDGKVSSSRVNRVVRPLSTSARLGLTAVASAVFWVHPLWLASLQTLQPRQQAPQRLRLPRRSAFPFPLLSVFFFLPMQHPAHKAPAHVAKPGAGAAALGFFQPSPMVITGTTLPVVAYDPACTICPRP